MTWWRQRLNALFLFGSLLLATGCSSTDAIKTAAIKQKPEPIELAHLLTETVPPRVGRGQAPAYGSPAPPSATGQRPSPVQTVQPVSLSPKTPNISELPSLIPQPTRVDAPAIPIPTKVDAKVFPGFSPASHDPAAIKVRAWVNSRPIFDNEIFQVAAPSLGSLQRVPEAQRAEKMADLFNKALDRLIDQEVMYQDAIRKLEKFNPKGLEKLKEYAGQEFEGQMSKLREAGLKDDQIREIEPVAKRIMERSTISMEYARSKIKVILDSKIGVNEIREYYDAHPEEFKRTDKVEWQNVFIAVGPKHPTLESARSHAQSLLARIKQGGDFAKLVDFGDGDSRFRGGKGFGQAPGEIRPPEVEPHLFKLRDGEIGPIVEIGTGVHLFRLIKREYAGLAPFNEETQNLIRRKLTSEIADREFRRLARDLRSRSVVRVERD